MGSCFYTIPPNSRPPFPSVLRYPKREIHKVFPRFGCLARRKKPRRSVWEPRAKTGSFFHLPHAMLHENARKYTMRLAALACISSTLPNQRFGVSLKVSLCFSSRLTRFLLGNPAAFFVSRQVFFALCISALLPTCTSLRASDRRHWRGNPFPL